jgi:hypothetical protein
VCAEVDQLVSLTAEETELRTRLAGVAQGESGQVVAAVASTPSAVVVAAEPAKGSEIMC